MLDNRNWSAGDRHLAIVLGVHRSGTSLLTAGLEAIGAKLGAVERFSEEDNPKGYFEHPAIRDFNDTLMKHIGITWDNWGFYCPHEDLEDPKFDAWRRRGAELLQHCFDGPGQWGLKEPRMTTLLPFWNSVFAQLGWSCKRILILRHPDEVAASQRQRFLRRPEQFKVIAEPEPMHALWSITMHGALASMADDETLLIRHDELYVNPEDTLRACAGFLGLTPDPQAIADFARDFFDPSLRRAMRSPKVTGDAWGELARHFYAAFSVIPTPGRLLREQATAIADQQQSLKVQLPFLGAVRSSISRLAEARSSVSQGSDDIYIPSFETIRSALGLQRGALEHKDVSVPSHFLKFLFEVILRLAPFNEADYRAKNPDLAAAEKEGIIKLLEHFLNTGWYEGRAPGEYLVDETWYQNVYDDVALAVREGRIESGWKHFNDAGMAEGRVGSAEQSRWKDLWDRALRIR